MNKTHVKFLMMNARCSLIAMIILIMRVVFEYLGYDHELISWANISASVLFTLGGVFVTIGLIKWSWDEFTMSVKRFVRKFNKA